MTEIVNQSNVTAQKRKPYLIKAQLNYYNKMKNDPVRYRKYLDNIKARRQLNRDNQKKEQEEKIKEILEQNEKEIEDTVNNFKSLINKGKLKFNTAEMIKKLL